MNGRRAILGEFLNRCFEASIERERVCHSMSEIPEYRFINTGILPELPSKSLFQFLAVPVYAVLHRNDFKMV
jgi:hypothetical protein